MIDLRHYQLRSRTDRRSKKARCSCGWEGVWRSTPSTGRRHRDAAARLALASEDFQAHKSEAIK